MKRILTVTLAITLLLLSGCARQTEPNPPEPEPLSTAEVVSKVNPSVVQIVTADGTGSGIILDTDGHVLTNNHVIEKAASANVVVSDGRTLSAQILNRDWSIDLAVLKVTASGLQPATLGSSSEVQLGEDVITLGYPLDLGSSVTVTKGIVSAFREPYLQTDAPVNPGNSGGPLVNMLGEIIGVVTAKPSTQGQEPAEGIGFAIAVDQVKDVLTRLLSPEKPSSLIPYTTVADIQGSSTSGLLSVDAFDNIHYLWGESIEWQQSDVKPKLMYSVQRKGAGWSTPEMVAEGSPNALNMWTDDKYVAPLAISVDSEATVHVIWTQNYPQDTGGFGIDLFYASKPLDQPWSTPTLLCVEESFPPQASLAVDTADTLHLVYGLTGCFQWQEEYQYLYKPKAGTWCQPELIGGTQQSGCMSSLTLTCSTQANLLLAYCRDVKIYSAQKPAGSPWSSPTPIAQAEGFCSPQSLADSEDTALLAFQDVDNARIACSSLQPDHSWSAIQYLSGFDHRSGNVQLGKNPSGKVYAVWVRTPNPEDAAGDSLVLRWKTSDNSWSPEQLVYTAVVGSISQYSFVVDSTDTLHFNIRERETTSDPYDPFIYQGFYLTVPFAQVIT